MPHPHPHSLPFRRALVWFGVAAALIAPASGADSFAYFRSDGGRPHSTGSLPSDLDTPAALRWRAPLPVGQSSPTVSNGRIFLTGYDAEIKSLVTIALDQSSGKVLWQQPIMVGRIEEFHPQMGTAAPATPAVDGKHVYVFFGSYGLVCYDLEGKLVWEKRLGPFRDEYGAGSSPILIDDQVVLSQDHDVDSFVAAYDRSTGRELWRTPRPDAVRSYSTPVVWSRGDRKELLVAGALELAGYNPANGEKLWWTYGLARIVIPLPLVDGERIYMASWSPGGDPSSRIALDAWEVALNNWDADKNGQLTRAEIKDANVLDRFFRMDLDESGQLTEGEWNRHAEIFRRAQNALLAIQPSKQHGQLPEEDVVWTYPRGAPYVATPLLERGNVWMVKDGGIVTKIEARSGQRLAEERLAGPGSYYASPVTGDGKIYFCSEPGVVTVVANQPDWRVISSRNFREKIHATPAIRGDRLFVRTEKALYCFQGK